jgi:ABC-type multidrug transport system permease subunit
MLRVLLAKDLRRAWRNPLPWLINLIVPLVMTALIGFVFGGGSDNNALGRIRFAVVDEDQSALGKVLRGAVNQSKGGDYLEPVFMQRDDALKLVNANKISAVLIIETNFTRNYLTGREPVSLHLIKNPAESIHPAVLEELLGAAVSALNALSRNFHSDFPEWQAVIDGGGDYRKVSELINRTGDKLESAEDYVGLVRYESKAPVAETKAIAAQGKDGHPSKSGAGGQKSQLSETFAYLLLGMSAMFLLFLGQNAMTDLHRELRKRTFERYQTMHQQLWPFILGKIIFAVVMLLICSAVMIGGGGLAFGVHWENPLPLLALVAAYSCFVAALFAVLVAVVPDERRAGVLNNIAGMALGLVGGCAFPPRQLPAFLREHVTSLMPSYWFTDTARNLQYNDGMVLWGTALFKLMLCAAVLAGLAAWLFRQKFKSGLRV